MVSIEKLKVVELFAGIGAWSKALENLHIDHEVLLAVENDEKTIKGYNLIHNHNFNDIDITKLNANDVPDCDLICYSPPCQAFSNAGKQLGFDDKRGILFFDALRIIKHKKPKYALMENVKGLTQKKFKGEFEVMLRELENAGYKNYWKVLNADNYGIPQNRERVFIISIRNDVDKQFEFPKPNTDLKFKFSEALEKMANENFYVDKEKAREVIKKLNLSNLDENKVNKVGNTHPSGRGMNGYVYSEIGICPTITTNKGEGHKILQFFLNDDAELPILHNIYGGFKEKKPRVFYDYSPTIRTAAGGGHIPSVCTTNPELVEKIIDGFSIRKMMPIECFRLMGFTDKDHNILKENGISNTYLYRLAGNSIVVDVCERLFQELLLK